MTSKVWFMLSHVSVRLLGVDLVFNFYHTPLITKCGSLEANLSPPKVWDSPLAPEAEVECSSSDYSRIPSWGSHTWSWRLEGWELSLTSLLVQKNRCIRYTERVKNIQNEFLYNKFADSGPVNTSRMRTSRRKVWLMMSQSQWKWVRM